MPCSPAAAQTDASVYGGRYVCNTRLDANGIRFIWHAVAYTQMKSIEMMGRSNMRGLSMGDVYWIWERLPRMLSCETPAPRPCVFCHRVAGELRPARLCRGGR